MIVYEALPKTSALLGDGGHYAHELILPLVRNPDRARSFAVDAPASDAPSLRFATPTGPWRYWRVTCQPLAVDEVIAELGPVLEAARRRGACRDWFFLRYAGASHELRLRARDLAPETIAAIDQRLDDFLRQGVIARFDLATYVRELERYGGAVGLELAEAIFCADSAAVAHYASHGFPAPRWLVAAAGVQQLFADFDVPPSTRASWLQSWRDELGREYGATAATWKHTGQTWRDRGDDLRTVLQSSGSWPALAQRRDDWRPAIVSLHRGVADGSIRRSLEELTWCFAHLHVHRVVVGEPRRQEMVLWDLLRRHTLREAARSR